ncbi:MAG: phosphatase PAP2 family protein [Clostridia bacterium]|nr:phosphatase PAP2 family protein [Clostridia bacterium]
MTTLAIILITGFFLGTVYDINISQALTGFSSNEGALSIKVGFIPHLLEILGYWTTPLFGAIALAVVEINMRKKLKRKGRLAFFCISLLAEAALMFYASNKTIKLIVEKLYIGHYILIATMTVVLTLLLRFCIENWNLKELASVFRPALFTLITLIVLVVCFETIKMVWGRVRFRELIAAGSLDGYTPWYLPNWFSGSKSFPSGHTGNATALMMLPLWFEKNLSKNKTTAMYAVILVWTIALAFSRICAGAHYLTDVIFGFFLGSIITNVSHYLYRKTIKKPSAESAPSVKSEIS